MKTNILFYANLFLLLIFFPPKNYSQGTRTGQTYIGYPKTASYFELHHSNKAHLLVPGNSVSKISIDTGLNKFLCPGASFKVPFKTEGLFNSDNVFSVELSDQSGSFESAITIGTLSSQTEGIIEAEIPEEIAIDNEVFNIRIISSSPADTSLVTPTSEIFIKDSYGGYVSISPGNPICKNHIPIFKANLSMHYPYPAFDTIYRWTVNEQEDGSDSAYYTNSSLKKWDILDCKVTSNFACPLAIQSEPLVLQVDSAVIPAVNIAAFPGDTLCPENKAAYFGITSIRNGGSNPVIEWYKNDLPVGNTPGEYVLEGGDKIYAKITSSLACASPALVESNKVDIVISEALTPVVRISIYGGNASACESTGTLFYADYFNAGEFPGFQWYKNGFPVGYNQDEYYDETLFSGDSITLRMTSSLSCSFPFNVVNSNSIMIVTPVSVVPSVVVASSHGNVICPYTDVKFRATASNGGNFPTYEWYKNGTPVGNGSEIYESGFLKEGDEIYVTVRSSETCASVSTATSNRIEINLVASLPLSINIETNQPDPVCSGNSLSFQALTTNSGSEPIYQWKKNGINVGSNSSMYNSNRFIAGDIIECIVMSSLTCASPKVAQSNSITVDVTTVVPTITTVQASCTDTSIGFTAEIANGGDTPGYEWYKNGVKLEDAAGPMYHTSNFTNNDTITCILTSNQSCAWPIEVVSNYVIVNPVYRFTGSGDWDLPSNWSDNAIPPSVLPSCATIIISPRGDSECVLNRPQTISPGAKLIVSPEKRLRVMDNLTSE